MKYDSDHYELSSGRRFYANRGILGIGDDAEPLQVSEGYDGGVGGPDDFSESERREIADFMIARWQAFANGK